MEKGYQNPNLQFLLSKKKNLPAGPWKCSYVREPIYQFYPAMTAFTDQYSLPNIFFDIGQL